MSTFQPVRKLATKRPQHFGGIFSITLTSLFLFLLGTPEHLQAQSACDSVQAVAMPNILCEDSLMLFQVEKDLAYTGDIDSVVWDFGDGSFGSGISTGKTYSNADTFMVQASIYLADSINPCLKTFPVFISPPPTASITPRSVIGGFCGTPLPSNTSEGVTTYTLCSAGAPQLNICLAVDNFSLNPNIADTIFITPLDDGNGPIANPGIDTIVVTTANNIRPFLLNWTYEVKLVRTDLITGCRDTWIGNVIYQVTPTMDIQPVTATTVCEFDTVIMDLNLTPIEITNLDQIVLQWGDGKRLFIGDSSLLNPVNILTQAPNNVPPFDPLLDEFRAGLLVSDTLFKHAYAMEEDTGYVCPRNFTFTTYTIHATGYNECGSTTATNQQNITIIPTPELSVEDVCIGSSAACFDLDICPFPGNYVLDSLVEILFYPNYTDFPNQSFDITIPYLVGQRSICLPLDSLDLGSLPTGMPLQPGTYSAAVLTRVDCGEKLGTATYDIQIDPASQVSVALDTLEGCTPFSISTINTAGLPFPDSLSYNWSIDGATSSPQSNWSISDPTDSLPDFSFFTAGNYEVCLTITGGCNTVQICENIIARAAPQVLLSPETDTLCLGDCVNFSVSTNPNNALNSIFFSDGLGGLSSVPQNNFSICYDSAGNFAPGIQVSNVCGTDFATSLLTVQDSIHEDVIPDTLAGCLPFTVNFLNQSFVNQGTIDSVRWSIDGDQSHFAFVGGSSDTSRAPLISFTYPRDYLLSLKMYNPCDIDTLTFHVEGFDAPQVGFLPVQDSICLNDCLDYTFQVNGANGDSTNALNLLSFNSGQAGFQPLSNFSVPLQVCYPDTGVYEAYIEAINVCGIDRDTLPILVQGALVPSVSIDTLEGCVPFVVHTQNSSSVSFGPLPVSRWAIDGNTVDPSGNWSISDPDAASPDIQFFSPGNYVLTHALYGACDTLVMVDTVVARQAPDFVLIADPDTICVANCVAFKWLDNTPNALTSVGIFDGRGTFVNNLLDSAVICYDSPGTFFPYLYALNACGTDTNELMLVVSDTTLNADISADTTEGCAPFQAYFRNNTAANGDSLDYRWSFFPSNGVSLDGGSSLSDPEISLNFSEPGDFQVYVEIQGKCNFARDSFDIVVNRAPSGNLTPSLDSICLGDTLTFNYISSINNAPSTLSFTAGQDTILANQTFPLHFVYDSVGTYSPMVVQSNVCGSDTSTSQIEVLPPPEKPGITWDGSDTLEATVLASSYRWYRGDTLITEPGYTGKKILFIYSGTYQVEAVGENGCPSPISNEYNFYVLGVNQTFQQAGYRFYPNPALERAFLEGPSSTNGWLKIAVYDLSGRAVYREELIQNGRKFRHVLDLRALAAGVYYLKVSDGSREVRKKFVKMD